MRSKKGNDRDKVRSLRSHDDAALEATRVKSGPRLCYCGAVGLHARLALQGVLNECECDGMGYNGAVGDDGCVVGGGDYYKCLGPPWALRHATGILKG